MHLNFTFYSSSNFFVFVGLHAGQRYYFKITSHNTTCQYKKKIQFQFQLFEKNQKSLLEVEVCWYLEEKLREKYRCGPAGIVSIPMLVYLGIDTCDAQVDLPRPELSRNTLKDESASGPQNRVTRFLFSLHQIHSRGWLACHLTSFHLFSRPFGAAWPAKGPDLFLIFYFFDATLGQHTWLLYSAMDSVAADTARRCRVTLFHLNRRVGDQTSDCDNARCCSFFKKRLRNRIL